MDTRLFALTIAGGRGERLKPITDTLPKPMVPLNGRPMISYQVDWMREQGVTDVVFLCGYKGERIRDYFGDGSGHGITAHYSYEDIPLGRGGAVKQGMELVPGDAETVLVTNGDNVTDQPLSEMLEVHRRRRALVTMMLAPYPSQYGVVESDSDGMVTRFVEKGKLPFWINAGIYLFDRSVDSMLPRVGDHETSTFQDLSAGGRIASVQSKSRWLTVDSPKDIKACEDALDAMGHVSGRPQSMRKAV